MLKPRIDDAYKELGLPDTTFDQTLERAIVVLLKTPIPEGRVPVEPNGAVVYRFADPGAREADAVTETADPLRSGQSTRRADLVAEYRVGAWDSAGKTAVSPGLGIRDSGIRDLGSPEAVRDPRPSRNRRRLPSCSAWIDMQIAVGGGRSRGNRPPNRCL